MKKCVFLLLGLLAVSACDKKSDSDVLVRQCGDYLVEMTFSDDGEKMHAVINGDALDLQIAVSASGARYVGVLNDTDVTLWGKGGDWTMFLNDEEPIICHQK
ncbi:MAG: MliC family protein [Muribaculaceae bacterium]|nr:MliC family protein [Muribaculaceae bacterium]